MMGYLIARKNHNKHTDSETTVYYKHFDGYRGVDCTKARAPRFEKEQADKIVRQLQALDNRGWHTVEE